MKIYWEILDCIERGCEILCLSKEHMGWQTFWDFEHLEHKLTNCLGRKNCWLRLARREGSIDKAMVKFQLHIFFSSYLLLHNKCLQLSGTRQHFMCLWILWVRTQTGYCWDGLLPPHSIWDLSWTVHDVRRVCVCLMGPLQVVWAPWQRDHLRTVVLL